MKKTIALLLLGLTAATRAQNLIVNGGFEVPGLPNPGDVLFPPNGSTAIPGWVFVDNVPTGVDADNVYYRAPYYGHPASEGQHFMYVDNHSFPSPSLNGIYQDFSTVPGQAYQVVFDATTEIAYGTPGLLRVSAGGTVIHYTLLNVNAQPLPPSPPYAFTGWSAYSFTFIADATTTRLQFFDEGFQIGGEPTQGNASPLLDNVRVFATDNLVANGSFEVPELVTGYEHLPPSALAPWQTTDDSFEVWTSGGTTPSANGRQNLEILSHAATVTIWQTVPTIPGEDYVLRFHHTPRPSVDSTLSVAVNGQTLATFAENGSALIEFKWQRFRTNFTALSNLTTIAFTDMNVGAAGTHLDNVVLERLPLRATLRVSEVEMCWETVTGKVYQVQYRSALTTNAWSDLGGPMSGTGTTNCIKDGVIAGEPQRFYRIMTIP